MGKNRSWHQKLDPHGRLQLEEGLPAQGLDVTVRLSSKDPQTVRQLEVTGLSMHSQIDDIVVGHVANAADLQHVAELPCVQEVQVSRHLYADRAKISGKDL